MEEGVKNLDTEGHDGDAEIVTKGQDMEDGL